MKVPKITSRMININAPVLQANIGVNSCVDVTEGGAMQLQIASHDRR